MADLEFTTTLIQLFFFSQLHRKFPLQKRKAQEKKKKEKTTKKEKTAVPPAGEGALAGTAKLVLDIVTQKNDAR